MPGNIRITLQEEDINDYRAAVERAQVLYDVLHNEKILYSLPSVKKSENKFEQQLKKISENINALSVVSPET